MGTWLQDLRYSLRALLARPGFTALVVGILALGLGANVTVFSVVQGVLLRPLAMQEPERLVRLFQSFPAQGLERLTVSRPDAEDWAAASHELSALGLYSTLPSGLVLLADPPAQVSTAYVSGSFFPTVGTAAARGRTLTPEDERGNDRVVVLSDRSWHRRFGADPAVVGSTVTLDGEPFTIAGVMPPAFSFPSAGVEMWAPLSLIPPDSIPRTRRVRWLGSVGRLAPGSTPEKAQAELSGIARGLAESFPDSNAGATVVEVMPLQEHLVGGVQAALTALLAAVGLVLLIACANVANLLLARGLAGQRRLTIAAALGAGRARLVRQLLIESLLLALAGCALGLLAAGWAIDALGALAGELLPRAGEVALDGRAIAFGLGAALVTALLCGLAPALRLTRPALASGLGAKGAAASGSSRLHGVLVVVEVALALTLMIGAGLVVRSLTRLAEVNPGFDPKGLLAVSFTLPDHRYPDRTSAQPAYHDILERVRSLPGVESAASIKVLPLAQDGERFTFTLDGEPAPAPGAEPWAEAYPVSTGFFRTLGVPLAGRDFTPADRTDAPLVAVVSQSLARRYFPGTDPVGRRLRFGERTVEIVGLAGDLKGENLAEEPAPTLYVHQEQIWRVVITLVVRATGDPAQLFRPVQQAIWAVDREQPIAYAATLEQMMSETLAASRFFTLLLAGFAGTALVLAALGIYGVLSFAVERRTREIGVRVAVGARGSQVLGLVIGRGMALVVPGLVAGSAAAFALLRLAAPRLSPHLYGVGVTDPLTFAAVPALLALVALLACYLPGRRAARIDPVRALRAE